MDNNTAVLLVADRELWQRQFARYARLRKRGNACIGYLLGGPLAVTALFLAGRVLPLVQGDIAPGHPRYADYRSGTEAGILVFAVFFALYCVGGFIFGRWLRKTHVMLGFNPDGSFPDVQQALANHGRNP
jgi:MFS family permease